MAHILHCRLALLLTMATVAQMAGCALIYAPSKEAVKQLKPDGDYAPVYLNLNKVWHEEASGISEDCQKHRMENIKTLPVCENPGAYVQVSTTMIRVGGKALEGKEKLFLKKSRKPEPGMIVKVDERLSPVDGEGVLEVRKSTEDCKWVGVSDPNLDTAETKVTNLILAPPVGYLLGLALGPIAAPIGFSLQYIDSKETAGIVCDGWDYRVAYKTWIANYRDL